MSDYYYYDGAKISKESKMGKELAKFDQLIYRPSENPFPQMLYQARHRPDGRRSVGEVLDSVCVAAGANAYAGAAEQWTRQCQRTVNNEAERQKAFESGWRATQQEALDALEAKDNEASNITAARHAGDARMSPMAQREAAEADHATLRHVPSIPERRLDKRSKAYRDAQKASQAGAEA